MEYIRFVFLLKTSLKWNTFDFDLSFLNLRILLMSYKYIFGLSYRKEIVRLMRTNPRSKRLSLNRS